MKHQDFTIRKGKSYISVTTALKIIHNEKLEKARDYLGDEEMDYYMEKGSANGTSFHEYSALIDNGKHKDIDFNSIPEPVKSMVDNFEVWKMNNVIKIFHVEKKFYSDKFLYCGTPDRVYQLVNQSTYDLIDFKTGKNLDLKKIRWQLSGYKEMLKENGIEVVNRIILHIRPEKIKVIILDPRDHVSDFQSFLYSKEMYIRYNVNK